MFKSTLTTLHKLASLKLAFVAILLLVAGILFSYFNQQASVLWVAIPLLILSANLLAAIVFTKRIRSHTGLLIFHLCLLGLTLLAALSQLTSMKGRVEITQGQVFEPAAVVITKQGLLHSKINMQNIVFEQGALKIDYAAGLRRGQTWSTVITDNKPQTIGDNIPFTSNGYRFYTTSNKGYAAIIVWQQAGSMPQYGAINFPSFPLYSWKQSNNWVTPAGHNIQFTLVPEINSPDDQAWTFSGDKLNGKLIIQTPKGDKQTLVPGQSFNVGDNIIRFEAITTWMGYSIFYDPFLNWFLLFSLAGVLGLAWHYYAKFNNEMNPLKVHPGIQSINNKLST